MKENIVSPLVSVIMPTYNRSYIIARAIESVLVQTYENLELIIIDDGSTDKTNEVVNTFNDDRIYYEWCEHKGVVSSVRNKGLNLSNGRYIAYLDSDCIWKPNFLEVMVGELNNRPGVGMVYCRFVLICQTLEGKLIGEEVGGDSYDYERLLRKNYIGMNSVLHRRECLDRVGRFDERLDCLEDWDLFIRIGKEYQVEFVDQILLSCYYREGGDNITTTVNPFNAYLLIYSKIRQMGRPLYPLIIEPKDEQFSAYCPDLEGCWAEGKTKEEVLSKIQDRVKNLMNQRSLFSSPIEFVILKMS